MTDVVLLGMGGSSLASLVLSSVLGESGDATLHVLDTTAPRTVDAALATLDPATTLYLVASKSGGTIEPNTLYAIFREVADSALGREAAGQRFIAITDPGSSLEALAAADGFRAVVSSPPTVGGRFSAMSVFGLVPAALTGLDVDVLLERALAMESACSLPDGREPRRRSWRPSSRTPRRAAATSSRSWPRRRWRRSGCGSSSSSPSRSARRAEAWCRSSSCRPTSRRATAATGRS